MKLNLTKGGIDWELGGGVTLNSRDKKLGYQIGEHLNLSRDGWSLNL